MALTSQLLLRNESLFQDSDLLLINPPADTSFLQWFSGFSNARIWTQDFADYNWFKSQDVNAEFGMIPDNVEQASQILLFQPREKARLLMWLHFCAMTVSASGSVWLIGENKAGIKSAGKKLDDFFVAVTKSDSARHCGLFEARKPNIKSDFDLETYRQQWLLGSPPYQTRFVSYPGAFAHGRLDKGSELLLSVIADQEENKRPKGQVLDFGCGIGVLGLSLLKLDASIKLTLLDSSAAALISARQSLLANELEAQVLASDGLTKVTDRVDWIISNPPFHRGIATNLDTAQDFFVQASQKLKRNGKLMIVQNRHLPYEACLKDHFGKVICLRSENDFKVMLASGPKLRKTPY